MSQPSALLAFQAALREHRKAAGLSQGGLASQLSMTRQNVAELESSGRDPTLGTAERIAASFGYSLAEFLESGKEVLDKNREGH